jgi:hypothetical protein
MDTQSPDLTRSAQFSHHNLIGAFRVFTQAQKPTQSRYQPHAELKYVLLILRLSSMNCWKIYSHFPGVYVAHGVRQA